MYTDVAQWTAIRKKVLKQGISRLQISRNTGINRKTVSKILQHKMPPGYRRRAPIRHPKLDAHTQYLQTLLHESELLPPLATLTIKRIFDKLHDDRGYEGSYSAVRDYISKKRHNPREFWNNIYDLITSLSRNDGITFLYLLSRADPPVISEQKVARFFRASREISGENRKPDKRALARQAAQDWMHSVLQGSLSHKDIGRDVGQVDGIEELLKQLYKGGLIKRNRALCVLAEARRIPRNTIHTFLGIDKTTCRKYVEAYKTGGVDALYSRKRTVGIKAENEEIKKVVFSTLHEPPSIHGINRTTWKWDDLIPVLAEQGVVAGKDTIRQITKEAGFKWRKARIVLTSNDPEYREKLQRVQDVLRNLQADEAFFSIDEFGPFAVKMKGGRKLVGPAENFTVPLWQKSKGCLIMTAALELSRNQVTHFYSNKKNTDEMIRMMDLLIKRYRGFRKLWLSWDAASWHMSKKLYEQIEAANVMAYITGSPIVDTAPLPAGAQFLNVIESVFSGLARGVIHNSDYKSVDEAKAAIDRYFEERNEDFQRNPKRAGKKIWGEERVVSEFHEANNCKDPRYR